ncbi:YqgE/AlgH family protein [Psychroflexus aestuariivivens]|uniref:YqgE/AlgH family protein n=1 Tax=Psychroflexus aestuariivivens TaxID=1795040 RepID=UPI000FDA6716|nr:YqgE/AlgH family protein [Psychroflexus aestuariivivens]
METEVPKCGNILISEPTIIGDITFNRSVILLAHYNSDGAVGFILNKPLEFNLDDIIPEVNFSFKIFNGGPVEQDNLYFIHNVPHLIEESIKIANGVFWGGSFETIIQIINNKEITENNIKFFLGYSGWDPIQLEDELKAKTWVIDDEIEPKDVFNVNTKGEFWQEKMKNLGGEYLLWSNAPENPNNN